MLVFMPKQKQKTIFGIFNNPTGSIILKTINRDDLLSVLDITLDEGEKRKIKPTKHDEK